MLSLPTFIQSARFVSCLFICRGIFTPRSRPPAAPATRDADGTGGCRLACTHAQKPACDLSRAAPASLLPLQPFAPRRVNIKRNQALTIAVPQTVILLYSIRMWCYRTTNLTKFGSVWPLRRPRPARPHLSRRHSLVPPIPHAHTMSTCTACMLWMHVWVSGPWPLGAPARPPLWAPNSPTGQLPLPTLLLLLLLAFQGFFLLLPVGVAGRTNNLRGHPSFVLFAHSSCCPCKARRCDCVPLQTPLASAEEPSTAISGAHSPLHHFDASKLSSTSHVGLVRLGTKHRAWQRPFHNQGTTSCDQVIMMMLLVVESV